METLHLRMRAPVPHHDKTCVNQGSPVRGLARTVTGCNSGGFPEIWRYFPIHLFSFGIGLVQYTELVFFGCIDGFTGFLSRLSAGP